MLLVKKIITLQLLLILVFTQVGYYFIYTYQQYCIKKEVRQNIINSISDDNFFVFNNDDKNLIWEESDEFSINGKMYDVAKVKVVDNKKYLYCLKDDSETNLVTNYYSNFSKENQSSKQKKEKQNIQFQFVALLQNEEPIIFLYKVMNSKHFTVYTQNAVFKSISKIDQPPKFLIA